MTILCEHYECRCTAAWKLAEQGLVPDAIAIHRDDQLVRCTAEPCPACGAAPLDTTTGFKRCLMCVWPADRADES